MCDALKESRRFINTLRIRSIGTDFIETFDIMLNQMSLSLLIRPGFFLTITTTLSYILSYIQSIRAYIRNNCSLTPVFRVAKKSLDRKTTEQLHRLFASDEKLVFQLPHSARQSRRCQHTAVVGCSCLCLQHTGSKHHHSAKAL